MSLKRYRVAIPEVWIHYYDVDAFSKEDALLIAAEEGEDIEELAEYSRTLENDDVASVEELDVGVKLENKDDMLLKELQVEKGCNIVLNALGIARPFPPLNPLDLVDVEVSQDGETWKFHISIPYTTWVQGYYPRFHSNARIVAHNPYRDSPDEG